MNENNLQLFSIIEPKLDIVVIGLDDHCDFSFIKKIENIFKKIDIKVEVLPIHHACSIYNFIAAEGRYTAGAFIPPKDNMKRMYRAPDHHQHTV